MNGNPGKRPIPAAPEFAVSVPQCPDHLDDEAKKEWRRVAKELRGAGLLSRVHRAALAAYCQLWSRIVKLEKLVQATGEVLSDKQTKRYWGKGGKEIIEERVKFYRSPYAIELHGCYAEMRSFMLEFGMTPVSATRVQASRDNKSDPFEEFLKRGKQA